MDGNLKITYIVDALDGGDALAIFAALTITLLRNKGLKQFQISKGS